MRKNELTHTHCITSAKALRYLIHGRSWQWFCFTSFALRVGQIVPTVENSAKKVLHATKLKFHDQEIRTREAKHFLNVQRGVSFWHPVCTCIPQSGEISSQEDFSMKNYFIRGSVLALTLGVAGMGSLFAQDAKPAQTDPQAAQPSQSQPSQSAQTSPTSAQTSKDFTGTIVKEKGAMMLKDSSSNVSYKVDDDNKVKDYEGKQVKVTGTLDSSTNVIHVDSIQGIS